MVVPPEAASAPPVDSPAVAQARRVRIVLLGLFLVGLAAALLIWGLLR